MGMSRYLLAALLAGVTLGAAAQGTGTQSPGGQTQSAPGGAGAGQGGQGGQGGQDEPGMDQGGGRHRHRGPPPEAIAACQGKAAGDACSFVGRRQENRTGTCFAPPARGSDEPSRPMACRPPRPQRGEGQTQH